MKIGYFPSSEEWDPQDLVSQAIEASEAGFEGPSRRRFWSRGSVPRRSRSLDASATGGTQAMLAEQVVCGPDVDRHVAASRGYADAGFDEVYINQIGPDRDAFFAGYSRHVLPQLR